MDIRFLGHACFELTEGDARVLVDPFLTGNPKAATKAEEVEATSILLTHGHSDDNPPAHRYARPHEHLQPIRLVHEHKSQPGHGV